MMAADRDLRLKGYEVYRFGGDELTDTPTTRQRLDTFFDRLSEREIAALVERFYAKVRVDPQIGSVFNNKVQNWDAHLALLKDFWSTVLLSNGRYRGNPLLAQYTPAD